VTQRFRSDTADAFVVGFGRLQLTETFRLQPRQFQRLTQQFHQLVQRDFHLYGMQPGQKARSPSPFAFLAFQPKDVALFALALPDASCCRSDDK